jgi:hypothetical protein
MNAILLARGSNVGLGKVGDTIRVRLNLIKMLVPARALVHQPGPLTLSRFSS